MKIRSFGAGATAIIAAFALASCAVSGAQSPSTSPTEVSTSSPISQSPTPSPTETRTASPTSPITSAPPSSSTLDTEKADRPLSLADFFQPESYWMEKRFDVADKANVSGIATETMGTGSSSRRTLELRLANRFSDTLTFKVGQANDSESSGKIVLVKVFGNDEQLEVQKVPFNTIQTISVPVKGVNALQIELEIEENDEYYAKSVLAVLSDIRVK